MEPEVMIKAQELLIELYKEYNNNFSRYGQYMTEPPSLEYAIKLLTNQKESGE